MKEKFYFWMAIIFGIPLFTYIPLGKILIRVFQICLIIYGITDFIKYKKIKKNYLVFYFSMFFLYYFSGLIISEKVLEKNFSFLIIPIFMLILSSTINIDLKEKKSYLKGLEIICFVNSLWGILEVFFWKTKRIELNNMMFKNLLFPERNLTLANKITGEIRAVGLSWDPYFLGFFSLVLFILTKNKIIKIMAIISLLLAGSRNSQLAFVIYIIYLILNKYNNQKIIKMIIFMMSIIGLLLIVEYKFSNISGQGDFRRYYYYLIPFLLIPEKSFFLTLTGGSFYTSLILEKYNKYNYLLYLKEENFKNTWFIESDWVNIFLGRGIIGFILYCILFFILIRKAKNDIIGKIFFCIFFLGFGYLYELYLPILPLYLFCFNLKKKEEVNEYLDNNS